MPIQKGMPTQRRNGCLVYDSVVNEWTTDQICLKVSEKPATPQEETPEEENKRLVANLKQKEKELNIIRADYRTLERSHNRARRDVEEFRHIRVLHERLKGDHERMLIEFGKNTEAFHELQSKVDMIVQRATSLELDGVEYNRQIGLKNVCLRQLLNFFSWRQDSTKKRAFRLTAFEIDKIVEIIRRGLYLMGNKK